MVQVEQLAEMARLAAERAKPRKFKQAFELIVALKDIDTRKNPLNINETVYLPNPPSKPAKICVFASGDLALRARRAGADRVVEPEELEGFTANKREARKLAQNHDFFLAEPPLMPTIGRILGPILGPRGKMPTPLPPNAPVEAMIQRLRGAVRLRTRNQLMVACKVGEEGMEPRKVAENAAACLSALERKLPMGPRNIETVYIKLTMGPPVKLVEVAA
jgi:large subunit ribosomal protein L1